MPSQSSVSKRLQTIATSGQNPPLEVSAKPSLAQLFRQIEKDCGPIAFVPQGDRLPILSSRCEAGVHVMTPAEADKQFAAARDRIKRT